MYSSRGCIISAGGTNQFKPVRTGWYRTGGGEREPVWSDSGSADAIIAVSSMPWGLCTLTPVYLVAGSN